MKIVVTLALIFLGLWLPFAFMDAIILQTSIEKVLRVPPRLATADVREPDRNRRPGR